jgi:hypothetical protein
MTTQYWTVLKLSLSMCAGEECSDSAKYDYYLSSWWSTDWHGVCIASGGHYYSHMRSYFVSFMYVQATLSVRVPCACFMYVTFTHCGLFLRSWFQTFSVFWMLFALFCVIQLRLKLKGQRFGTHCLFHLHGQVGTRLWRWNRQSVPKRWHLNYRRRWIFLRSKK